jgi:ATP-binding cassette subfamily B protein
MSSPHDDDPVFGKAYDARLARRLGRYLRPHAGLAAGSVALTGLVALLGAAPPALLGYAVESGVVRRDGGALALAAGLYVAAEGARFGALYAQQLAIALLGQRVMLDLRDDLARKVVGQSLAYFHREPVGRLVTRVVNDVGNIGDLFSAGAVAVVGDLFAIAISAAILLAIDARIAAIVLAAVPVLALALGGITRRIRAAFRELRRLLARNAAYLAETLSGVRVVQAFGREPARALAFRAKNDEHLEAQLASMRWHALYVSAITLITSGTIAFVILAGGGAALEGAIAVGALVAAIGYAQNLFQPIRDIAEKVATFQSAMASAERVFGMLDEDVEVRAPERPRALPSPLRGEIAFEGVSFAYSPRRTRAGEAATVAALRGVSVRIRPGERVAVVGRTGAGKSTFAALLSRFHDPTEGRVAIDGVDLREVDPRALRREVGVVLQDVFVFAGTVLDNIRLGDPRVSVEAAKEAARKVGAEEWILRLPKGYDEEMRERGATLSLGQKQLLSFARALAFDPRILVLDEATASVDAETEEKIRRAIREVMRGRTSILIAHRLATIQEVDRVLVFHRGELREEGTIDALLAAGGIFARLYRLQREEPAASPAAG